MVDGSISSAASVYVGVVVASVFPLLLLWVCFRSFFLGFLRATALPINFNLSRRGRVDGGRQDEPSKVDSQNEIERSKKK